MIGYLARFIGPILATIPSKCLALAPVGSDLPSFNFDETSVPSNKTPILNSVLTTTSDIASNVTALGAWPTNGRIVIQGRDLLHGAGVDTVEARMIPRAGGQVCRSPAQYHELNHAMDQWLRHWPSTPPRSTGERALPYPPVHNGQYLDIRWFPRSSVYRVHGSQYWLTAGDVIKRLRDAYVHYGCLTSAVSTVIRFTDGRFRPFGTLTVTVKPDPFPPE